MSLEYHIARSFVEFEIPFLNTRRFNRVEQSFSIAALVRCSKPQMIRGQSLSCLDILYQKPFLGQLSFLISGDSSPEKLGGGQLLFPFNAYATIFA